MRHARLSGTVIGCVALLMVGVVPARADAPTTTVTLDDAWAIVADRTNEVATFVNITREAFCTLDEISAENAFWQWVADGEVGDPPQDFPFAPASVPVQMTTQQVALGNIKASGSATVPVELWTFEEGKSWAAGNLKSPCIDTDGLVDLTDEAIDPGTLLASGSGLYQLKDNDWEGTGPRTNIWGERLTADLSGPGGDYVYTFTAKNQARDGDYIKGASTFTLRAR